MANYYASARTNYFRVTDEKRYEELVSNLISEDNICDFTENVGGRLYHCLGAYSSIEYLDKETEEYDFDMFLKELQKILPDGEVFTYVESGNEKLRYVGGYVVIVTNEEIKSTSLASWAEEQARAILRDSNYKLAMDAPPEEEHEIDL